MVLVHWKKDASRPFEVYSNLKNFSLAHPQYPYDTLNNYLSKKKCLLKLMISGLNENKLFQNPAG